MEFYNVKLLPKGLPEIISQLVPYDIYPDTKVIAYSRKWMGPRGHGGHCLGYAGYDDLTFSFHIGLYPTMCCSNGGHTYAGTYSFQLWMAILHTALHEIGHLATRELYYEMPHDIGNHPYNHSYAEGLADEWMNGAMARILRVDPRLGQPPGALTGYPGILAYEMRGNGGKPWDGFNPPRIAEWRGLKCDGQVAVGDVASHAMIHLLRSSWEMEAKSRVRLKRRDQVHKAANNLGIQRYAFSSNGRRYLMFNADEAEAVYEWLVENSTVLVDAYLKHQDLMAKAPKHWKWELVDGNWELVGIDTPEKVPPEQMSLPF